MDIEEKLINYKHKVAGKYLPVRSDQIQTRVFELEKYYLSTKIDGHLCFILKNGKEISILSHNNKAFDRDELTDELSHTLENEDGLFVGEIYSHHIDKKTRSYDLTNDIKNKESDIRIAVFDLIQLNNKEFSENDWNNKKVILKDKFKNGKKIYFLEEVELSSKKDIEAEFQKRVTDSNEEGIVVRGESGPVFKVKEYLSFDLVVLGYVTGHANDFSLMKEILVGVQIKNNTFLEVGIVVNGFSISDREKLSKDFEKIKVESDVIQVSNSKLPFTMIEPKYIVEIESTDVLNATSVGVIKKSVLSYEGKYLFENKSPSISLTTPVFIKFRTDKKVNQNDIGLNQITRVVNLDNDKKEAIDKKESKIIQKEIYVKETKGAKMVKKFLVWETNGDVNNYPKYVFYKTDYSPTRALKLKREIKVSNDKKQISDIFKKDIETDIKSGWNKI